ncbi:MAG: aminodeoxychorismate/anthranilate synthase component II [Acidimicrobiia bacterium]|nr:aminodeoxychorismate/anthranilate synthase component II [Acidimicrobiia bacterium]
MNVLVLDNYDSFTYNLVQYFGELGAEVEVVRNDVMDAKAARDQRPDRIVISPGPGRPENAGYSVEWISELGPEIPTLGVCLGHQAIAVAFGGSIVSAPEPRHGKTSEMEHNGAGVFNGLPNPFIATRYHSLVVDEPLPTVLEVTARSEDGVVQGLRHKEFPITGVQFHPESIMTTEGMAMLKNFLV